MFDFDVDLRMEVLNELVLDTHLGFGFNLGKVVGFARIFRVFFLLKRVRWNLFRICAKVFRIFVISLSLICQSIVVQFFL